MGRPFAPYGLLTGLLVLSFISPNGLGFFVAFEASLVPICLLILRRGLRPERVRAVAYMALYTLAGGGLHALGLASNFLTVGRVRWLVCEPFLFSGREGV